VQGVAAVTQLVPDTPVTKDDDVVLLTVPAAGAYLGVLRTATAGLAARLQFTLDEIEDLRIAVDEACAMLLAVAVDDAELACRFIATGDELTIETSVPIPTDEIRLPSGESFAWQVLSALTDEVSAQVAELRASIRLTKRRPTGY
jgi:serine/threonine-protein kinase RsbW